MNSETGGSVAGKAVLAAHLKLTLLRNDRQTFEVLPSQPHCRVIVFIELISLLRPILIPLQAERRVPCGLYVHDFNLGLLHAFMNVLINIFRDEGIKAFCRVHHVVASFLELIEP